VRYIQLFLSIPSTDTLICRGINFKLPSENLLNCNNGTRPRKLQHTELILNRSRHFHKFNAQIIMHPIAFIKLYQLLKPPSIILEH
ncbi:hypothetical protein L9F63_018837, partial [Diploptera punctata]